MSRYELLKFTTSEGGVICKEDTSFTDQLSKLEAENTPIDGQERWPARILLDVDPRSSKVLYKVSSPTNPGGIILLDTISNEMKFFKVPDVVCSPIVTPFNISRTNDVYANRDLQYKFLSVPFGGVTYENNCSLLLPSKSPSDSALPTLKNKKVPLIVVPHGGPHSMTPSLFMASYAWLAAQGYAILHVNYRGSIGWNQVYVETLAGNIGDYDVIDCVSATEKVLAEYDFIDKERVGVCGGSHGGFLVGHLTGQRPDLFKVGAMRNPVTNVATMLTVTDISDWCYVEGLGVSGYDFSKFSPPTGDELVKLWNKSPARYIDGVKAPTLICLGLSDQRVPPSQGLEWYYSLRSRGVATKLITYEKDIHSLNLPPTEADHWLNIKNWFDEHL